MQGCMHRIRSECSVLDAQLSARSVSAVRHLDGSFGPGMLFFGLDRGREGRTVVANALAGLLDFMSAGCPVLGHVALYPCPSFFASVHIWAVAQSLLERRQ